MFAGFQVFGLRRKPLNGTFFYIQQNGNPAKGFAKVERTIRRPGDPQGDTIVARLTTSGTEFSFRSKDTVAWPHAEKAKSNLHVWRSKIAKTKRVN